MANTVQLLKDGQPVYPITDVSLVIGLEDAIKLPPVKVTTLPTASAETAGKMYYVGPDANDEYERYITSATGGSYSWIDLGDTSIPLPSIADNLTTNDANTALSAKQGVVLDGKVSQLGQKVGEYTLEDGYYYSYQDTNVRIYKVAGTGYSCAKIKVVPGMSFRINGTGGSGAARLWIQADGEGYPISFASASATASNLQLVIGEGVEYLYINTATESENHYVRCEGNIRDEVNAHGDIIFTDSKKIAQLAEYYAPGENLLPANYLDKDSYIWNAGILGADGYSGGSTTTQVSRPLRLPKGTYQMNMVASTSRIMLFSQGWSILSTSTSGNTKIVLNDDAYLVISCYPSSVASLKLSTGTPLKKGSLSKYNSLLEKEETIFKYVENGHLFLDDTTFKQSDMVGWIWNANGTKTNGNNSTPEIPIKKGSKVDVFMWSATSPSSAYGLTVLKDHKFVKQYTCSLVSDATSFVTKTSITHSSSTLYKFHCPSDLFDADGMSIQLSGTTTLMKFGNFYIVSYDESIAPYGIVSQLVKFDKLTEQDYFPMEVEGTAGDPGAKYTLKVPLGNYFNIRFKFRITEALVNGAYANARSWAANTSYLVGELVYYSNYVYICTAAHTSSTTFDTGKFTRKFLNIVDVFQPVLQSDMRCSVWPIKLSQITSSYTYDGNGYTSYWPSFYGGSKFASSIPLGNRKYKNYLGHFAMSVRYIGEESSASIQNTGTSIILKAGGYQVANLAFSTYDTMIKLYDAVKAVSGFSVDYSDIEGHTPEELAIFPESQLISTYYGNTSGAKPTDYNQEQYTDNPPMYLPYAVYPNWIQAELVGINDKMYFCVEGITTEMNKTMQSVASLVFGGDFDVLFKDIEIDMASTRDAEVFTQYAQNVVIPNFASEVNPYIIVYEGHGLVDSPMEESGYPGDTMSCSVDRLQAMYDTLTAKGYVSVSLKDIVEHYKNGKRLPKRCFTMIFDDFRFGNFLDLKNRSAFTRNSLYAALAVITNQQTTITYNGQTITIEKAIAIGKNAGFECYSHTKDHRYMESEKPSDLADLARADIYDGDEKGINPNILIFPYGNNTPYLIDTLKWVGLAGGITIDVGNPLGNNPLCIVRQDLSVSTNIDDIITHAI